MPTFIKTGYWESAVKSYKGWLNLEELITNTVPPQSSIYTENGALTSNRTVTMGAFTLSFEKDIRVNGLTVGLGLNNVSRNTVLGDTALSANIAGTGSVAIGFWSLKISNSNYNIGLGAFSGLNLTSGVFNLLLGTSSGYSLTIGNYNTFIGKQAGIGITSGEKNIVISSRATGISGIVTGNYNTIIGNEVGGLSSSTSNNVILADGQGNQRLVFNSSGQGVAGSSAYPTFVSGIQFDIIGKARATSLNLSALPTSSVGLSAGDVWSDGGILKIV